ncbi:MAG: HipA domain-containing protein, partial [Gemmiger qucibialis]
HSDGSFDVLSLRKWWAGRGIPASRSGLEHALETLHIPYAELLLVKCSGLSLSDQYWVTPCDAPQNWRDVNFYENDFSDDVGRALFGEGVLSAQPDLCSPCNTSDGFLQKRWRIADGKRILLKAGSGIYKQEPYNEIVATALYDALGMPHVPYWLVEQGGQVMSACACFTNDHTELVTAAQFMRLLPQAQGVSNWEHFNACCRAVGIPDAKKAVCNMLAADFILANTDRHLGNFGFLRDSETLEWKGTAPIYDSGTSLWQMTLTRAINAEAMVPAKPFETSQQSQLKLIAPYVDLPLERLDGFSNKVEEIFRTAAQFDDGRAAKIAAAVSGRIQMLRFNRA